jgi:hypothetical protein
MTTTIYGPADVAETLGVTRAAVTNWLARYDDWPEADFITLDGRLFWTSLVGWQLWHALVHQNLLVAS